MTAFHETRFPDDISLGATGGPERRTDVVTLGSGFEQRNARWADSRRKYDAGYGVRTLDQLHAVLAFFEERRGRLYGFRWRDWADFRSCPPLQTPQATDQSIGTGTGALAAFQLGKRYGSATFAPYDRVIRKPVQGTALVAVAGAGQIEGVDYDIDYTTGVVTFRAGRLPGSGAAVTAGFEFDVPARFDTDSITINVQNWRDGDIAKIPIIEIRI